jgi:hypothetical protein
VYDLNAAFVPFAREYLRLHAQLLTTKYLKAQESVDELLSFLTGQKSDDSGFTTFIAKASSYSLEYNTNIQLFTYRYII